MSGSVVFRSVIIVGRATATIEPSIENISTPITHSAYRRYPRCQERSAAPISWSSSLNHRWLPPSGGVASAARFLLSEGDSARPATGSPPTAALLSEGRKPSEH